MPMSLRPAAVLAPAGLLALLVLLAACAELQPLPADPTGRLFGRGLDQIADLYIVPVSSRMLALAAAARLSQLDPKFAVLETPGPEDSTEIALDYGGREIATYPSPSERRPASLGRLAGPAGGRRQGDLPDPRGAAARTRSTRPCSTALPARSTASRAMPRPTAARDQRAARDGFGGIGVTLDPSPDRFRIIQSHAGRTRRSGRHPRRRHDRGDRRPADCRPLAERRDPPASRPGLEHRGGRHRSPRRGRKPRLPAAADADRRADGDAVAR